ncbi:MAG: HyaD/HybD family hydrogenase maturation endopeptidase [Candidatus Binatia bacterium]
MARHPAKKLILGLGNLLLKDEGIGVHVLRELEANYTFEKGVRTIDGGTGGPRLLPHIIEADHLIVVDAIQSGEAPGSLFRLTVDDIAEGTLPQTSLHELGLTEVLQMAQTLGRQPSIVILGVEPQDISSWGMELTPTLAEKVPVLVQMVLEELKGLGVVFERGCQESASRG